MTTLTSSPASFRLVQGYSYTILENGFPTYEAADKYRRIHYMGRISLLDDEIGPLARIEEDMYTVAFRDNNGNIRG